MQTFLSYKSFAQSATVLDVKRLGKQRLEVLQILNTLTGKSNGWASHPAVKMWRGYEYALIAYGLRICEDWSDRGYEDTCWSKIYDIEQELFKTQTIPDSKDFYPTWLTDEFCLSHQSNLVRKNPDHYRRYFPGVPDNLPYIWPVSPSLGNGHVVKHATNVTDMNCTSMELQNA